MTYLLDTNICIHFLRGQYNLLEKLQEIEFKNCAISEITLAELTYGAENSPNPIKNLELIDKFIAQIRILPIFNAIKIYAKEKARLRKMGQMISDFDILIAATSIANKLIMVSENEKDLNRISDIQIQNWIER